MGEIIQSHLPLVWTWVELGLEAFLLNLARYVVVAGFGFLLAHRLLARRFGRKRIQAIAVTTPQLRRELLLSLATLGVFMVMDVAVAALYTGGYTRIYTEIEEKGWAWFAVSIVVAVLIHDAYFYWIHRLMHWGPLYRHVHAAHHRSTNPTPLAALAFHPLEAMLEFGVVVVLLLALPMHAIALFIFVNVMIVMNVLGHLGFEFYPKGFVRNPVGRWLITATHHNMHHRTFRHNYGFYLLFWDRLMGTNHPAYETQFEAVAGRKAIAANPIRST